jgi:hypothetical protein
LNWSGWKESAAGSPVAVQTGRRSDRDSWHAPMTRLTSPRQPGAARISKETAEAAGVMIHRAVRAPKPRDTLTAQTSKRTAKPCSEKFIVRVFRVSRGSIPSRIPQPQEPTQGPEALNWMPIGPVLVLPSFPLRSPVKHFCWYSRQPSKQRGNASGSDDSRLMVSSLSWWVPEGRGWV